MNSRWWVAALPVGAALLTLAGLTALGGSARAEQAYVVGNVGVLGAAAVGGLLAAREFSRGDYLRRAWVLIGACYAVLVLDTLLFGASTHSEQGSASAGAALTSGVLTSVANGCTIAGMLLASRAWKAAGLDLQGSRGARLAVTLTCLALAVGLAGASAWGDLRALLGGDLRAFSDLASDVGDIVTLAVLAPLLLTAFALRGGSLAWPWSLLAVSSLGWLLFDGTVVLADVLHADAAALRPLEEAFRVLACVANLSAGLLQRSVRVRPAGAHPPVSAAIT